MTKSCAELMAAHATKRAPSLRQLIVFCAFHDTSYLWKKPETGVQMKMKPKRKVKLYATQKMMLPQIPSFESKVSISFCAGGV